MGLCKARQGYHVKEKIGFYGCPEFDFDCDPDPDSDCGKILPLKKPDCALTTSSISAIWFAVCATDKP
jgi:hypothetical protein